MKVLNIAGHGLEGAVWANLHEELCSDPHGDTEGKILGIFSFLFLVLPGISDEK